MSKNITKTQIQTTETTETKDWSKDLEQFQTKSAKIRYLDGQGVKRGQIADILNIRYQHVRNVLITPVKKA